MIRNIARPGLCAVAALMTMSAAHQSVADQSAAIVLQVPRETAQELRRTLPPSDDDPLEVLGLTQVAQEDLVVPVTMRDGVQLAATIIRPRSGEGKPLPTVLIRSPYRPADEVGEPLAKIVLPRLVKAGYAIVIVNDRGTQWSQGSYHWMKGQNRDGYDILSWIAKQPWSTGRVGTYGCSSSAESQLGLATLNHPAHKAVVEIAGATGVGSIPGYTDQGIFYHGGIHDLVWGWWFRYFGHQAHPLLPSGLSQAERVRVAKTYSPEPVLAMPADLAQDAPEVKALLSTLPIADILRVVDGPTTEWDSILRWEPSSPEWRGYDLIETGDSTRVPGLHIDTWYDTLEAYPTTKVYEQLSKNSPNQYMVLGAGAHCTPGDETADTSVGDTTVGDARFDYAALVQRWFDRWLKEDPAAIDSVPRVQYYLLNSSEWKSAAQWPPQSLRAVKMYLHSGGHANSRFGDGRLLQAAPAAAEAADAFAYDPLHPAPSLGGNCCSASVAREQSPIELRQDVLVYTTPPFDAPTRIVGDVNVTLSVSSSARDTDIIVRLTDVYPDGRSFNLTETGQRMRYRRGVDEPTLMQEGKIYETTVTGMVTAIQLAPGHRLRVQVTSSNFPNYERNLNTGGRNFDESDALTARTQIHHDAAHPSYVAFSVQ